MPQIHPLSASLAPAFFGCHYDMSAADAVLYLRGQRQRPQPDVTPGSLAYMGRLIEGVLHATTAALLTEGDRGHYVTLSNTGRLEALAGYDLPDPWVEETPGRGVEIRESAYTCHPDAMYIEGDRIRLVECKHSTRWTDWHGYIEDNSVELTPQRVIVQLAVQMYCLQNRINRLDLPFSVSPHVYVPLLVSGQYELRSIDMEPHVHDVMRTLDAALADYMDDDSPLPPDPDAGPAYMTAVKARGTSDPEVVAAAQAYITVAKAAQAAEANKQAARHFLLSLMADNSLVRVNDRTIITRTSKNALLLGKES